MFLWTNSQRMDHSLIVRLVPWTFCSGDYLSVDHLFPINIPHVVFILYWNNGQMEWQSKDQIIEELRFAKEITITKFAEANGLLFLPKGIATKATNRTICQKIHMNVYQLVGYGKTCCSNWKSPLTRYKIKENLTPLRFRTTINTVPVTNSP